MYYFDKIIRDEKGLALLLVVFVVSLATVLVMGMAQENEMNQRTSRGFTESIQADYLLKSALNLGRVLLEFPLMADGQPKPANADSLHELWAKTGEVDLAPFLATDLGANLRIQIVDEGSKINLNAIRDNQPRTSENPPGESGGLRFSDEDLWKSLLSDLFRFRNFSQEQYSDKEFRTIGNQAFDSNMQVAIIHDWIDTDSQSHKPNVNFNFQGIESGAEKTWFYNRPLETLSEIALIPGMTLERLSLIAPFVRTDDTSSEAFFNINTINRDLLTILCGEIQGIPEEILRDRDERTLDDSYLNQLRAALDQDGACYRFTRVYSFEFAIYAEAKLPNITRMMRAVVKPSSRGNPRTFDQFPESLELY